jgi:hypothetical protein
LLFFVSFYNELPSIIIQLFCSRIWRNFQKTDWR